MIAYRHGLRVFELVALRWEQVDLGQGLLHVNRMKRGIVIRQPRWMPERQALLYIGDQIIQHPVRYTGTGTGGFKGRSGDWGTLSSALAH